MESTCNALNKQQQAQTWWLNGIVVIFMHLLAIYALIFITPSLNTIYFAMYMFQFSAIGITMGYHRLWSHRSFKAEFPLKFILAIAGCCAFQGSIKWVFKSKLVGTSTSTSSQIHRHWTWSVLCKERFPILSYSLDLLSTKLHQNETHWCIRSQFRSNRLLPTQVLPIPCNILWTHSPYMDIKFVARHYRRLLLRWCCCSSYLLAHYILNKQFCTFGRWSTFLIRKHFSRKLLVGFCNKRRGLA